MQSDDEFREQLSRIRGGDASALNAMLDSWQALIRLHAHGLLGTQLAARADSSDVVQETMLQAFQEFPKFRGQTKGEWMAWLRSILLAKAGRLRRIHNAEMRSVGQEAHEQEASLEDSQLDPAEQAIKRERLSQVALTITELSTPMCEVIFRRVFLNQPFEQVAEVLQRTPGSTRVLWTRAVRELRDRLQSGSTDAPENP